MEYNGLDVDVKNLRTMKVFMREKLLEKEDGLYNFPFVKPTDSLNSLKDIGEIFYTRENGLELFPPDLTNKGSPSTNKNSLRLLLTQINEELLNRDE